MYEIGKREAAAVAKVIESGQLFRYRGGEGGQCDQFEAELSAKTGAANTVIVNSGTSALICALAGCGIGPGDEVIVPAYTFMATPLAVLGVGAIPVLAEVDSSLGIDPKDVEKKISAKTKAIMPVHMMGLPCNMNALKRVAKKHKLDIIEDACQAVGGSYKGKRLGSIGRAGAFSFNHFKIISCGEGGAVLTSDRAVYERALCKHDGGAAFRANVKEMAAPVFAGVNMRSSEVLGAIMREQLKRLDGILKRLRARKKAMAKALPGAKTYKPSPVNCADGDCGVVMSLLLADEKRMRTAQAALREAGVGNSSPIDSGIHVYSNWEPILKKRASHHPAFNPYNLTKKKYKYTKTMCPETTRILSSTLFLNVNFGATVADARAMAKKAHGVLAGM